MVVGSPRESFSGKDSHAKKLVSVLHIVVPRTSGLCAAVRCMSGFHTGILKVLIVTGHFRYLFCPVNFSLCPTLSPVQRCLDMKVYCNCVLCFVFVFLFSSI